MARSVSWGVLSTAKIGTEKVIPAMQRGEIVRVDAIASRDLARGREVAARLGIGKVYGSYEELLADPDITAIYNPLPNHLHVPWTVKAMEAGKHVLCEKPIALSRPGSGTPDRGARAHRPACRRGLHGPPPPAMAASPRDRPQRADRRRARHPDVLLLLQRRSRQHPQSGRYRRRRPLRHRLLLSARSGGRHEGARRGPNPVQRAARRDEPEILRERARRTWPRQYQRRTSLMSSTLRVLRENLKA